MGLVRAILAARFAFLLDGLAVETVILEAPVASDFLVERRVKKPVVLLHESFVGSTMQAELAALAEGLETAIDTADEGLLARVRVLVFPQVLRQRKHLAAKLARERLLPTVDVVVSF